MPEPNIREAGHVTCKCGTEGRSAFVELDDGTIESGLFERVVAAYRLTDDGEAVPTGNAYVEHSCRYTLTLAARVV